MHGGFKIDCWCCTVVGCNYSICDEYTLDDESYVLTWDSDLWLPYIEASANYWNSSFFNLSYSYSTNSKVIFIVEWIFEFSNADTAFHADMQIA